MNAVSKVNIAGLVFQIDDEALIILEVYLNRLRQHYECQESGSEIMESIEERVADLLAEKKKGREIVGVRSVEEVIEILGEPDRSTEESSEEAQEQAKTPPVTKKLFRDPDHKVFGGLFAGVAYYMGIKRNILRLLFIVFAFYMEIMFWKRFDTHAILWLFFVIAYIVLCFVVPVAKTWGDRMAMNGEAPDLSSIENQKSSNYYSNVNGSNTSAGDSVFHQLGVGFMRFMGLIFTIISIVLIVALVFFFFFPEYYFMGFSWGDFFRMLGMEHADWVVGIAFTGFFALAGSFLYSGIKALFQLNTKWRIGLVLNLVFITSIIVLGFMCVPFGLQFSHKKYSKQQDTSVSSLPSDTLYLEQELPADFSGKRLKQTDDRVYWDAKKGVAILYPDVNLFVTVDSTDQAVIRSIRTQYYNRMSGVELLSDSMQTYELIGNRLIIKGCSVSPKQPWNRTVNQLNIFLPKGYKVIKKGLFLLDIDRHDQYYLEDQDWDADNERVIVL